MQLSPLPRVVAAAVVKCLDGPAGEEREERREHGRHVVVHHPWSEVCESVSWRGTAGELHHVPIAVIIIVCLLVIIIVVVVVLSVFVVMFVLVISSNTAAPIHPS